MYATACPYNCLSLDYLAGLLDGEGSIFVANMNLNLTVQITNTNHLVMHLIHRQFGGHLRESAPGVKGRRTQYTIFWHGKEGQALLRKLEGRLIIKRELAELAICFPILERFEKIDEEIVKAKIAISKKISSINHGV